LGKKQMQSLGAKLRSKYIEQWKFLPKNFQDEEFLARCTPTPRTEESLQNVFKGLYPDSDPPAIVTHTPTNEPMWYETSDCQRLKDLFREFHSDPKYKQYMSEEIPALAEKLRHYLLLTDKNGNVPSGKHWPIELYDYFKCHRSINDTNSIPANVPPGAFEKLEEMSVLNWFEAFKTKTIARLGMGRFLSEILGHMDKRIGGKSDLKLVVFSGHDTTVGPVLVALDVFDDKWPPIASNLILELLEEKQNPQNRYVRLIYNDRVLQIPGCNGTLCPYATFRQKVKELIPNDFHTECKSSGRLTKAEPDQE